MERFNSILELEKFYDNFNGKTLEELYQFIEKKYPNITLTTNKGIVGQVLEALIGNPPNSNPNPDVTNIKVELKVLPLRESAGKIQPKERSKIKSINYNKIAAESWNTSEVKSKMENILFLLYEQPTGKTYKNWKEFEFKGTMLYQLASEQPTIVQQDWETIRSKVVNEIADQLSEGDSKILGACTSGTGKLQTYGNNKQAKQRSYSLKHSFLKVYYQEKKRKTKFSSLPIEANIPVHVHVSNLLSRKLSGKTLKEIANEFQVDFSKSAKSSFALLINRALKVDDKAKIREIEESGLTIKTIPVNPANNKTWESMSFPKFSLVDLIDEEWDGEPEASFKNIVADGFIFLPVYKEKERIVKNGKKKLAFKHWSTWKVGEVVFWKPSQAEMSQIEKEWKEAKRIVTKGVDVKLVKHGGGFRQENNLLKASNTQIIHIRPHARDAKDIDKPYEEFTKGKVSICWQSFWLNGDFVGSKIQNKTLFNT